MELTEGNVSTYVMDEVGLPKPDKKVQVSRVSITKAKVKSMRNLTHDTYEIILKGDTPLLGAKAGQFGTIKVGDVKKPRSYSFARDPRNEKKNEHTFFIRLVSEGEMSQWLSGDDRVGTEVTLSGPLGEFGLDSSDDAMICIAGGSGMSAVYALLESAALNKVKRDCYFFYGARTQEDLYLNKEIDAIKKQWDKNHTFEFVQVLNEEPEGSSWKGARGFVTDYFKAEYLEKGKVDINKCKAFFCGPPPMIDAGAKVLIAAGMDESSIHYDKFEDASSPAPVIDNEKCVLCDECLLVKPTENCIVEIAGLNGKDYVPLDPANTSGLYYNTLYIDEDACIRCYACVYACPHDAISPENSKTPSTLRKMAS